MATPRVFTPHTSLAAALQDAAARSILQRYLPEMMSSPGTPGMRFLPLEDAVRFLAAGYRDPLEIEPMWRELSTVELPAETSPSEDHVTGKRTDYESAAVRSGSAPSSHPDTIECWDVFELALDGPTHGNPFLDVEVGALFRSQDRELRAGGFYDGEGRYIVRFMPPAAGEWSFITESSARSLHGIVGRFIATPASESNHGPVTVASQFHFSHADGTRYLPLGTTAYAWTHQDETLQEETLRTLATAPFTKVRMCVFPKWFMYNTDEPKIFPFPMTGDSEFDFTGFEPAYFRLLERRIRELAKLGVEADLILFHPYDRWGFADLSRSTDDRYVRYVVRRLSAFRNVWWSLANEYDLLRFKTAEDWDRLAGIVVEEDHAGHLRSIHNWVEFFDHGRAWVTHCSIQSNMLDKVGDWRSAWGKPVVIDECGYEGDIDQGWGSITGEELTRLCWEGAVRGGYVGHGETYLNEREELWWSKGGALVGLSPERIRFLISIIEASPSGVLDPLPGDWDVPWAGVADQYLIAYFGARQPRFRDIIRPPGVTYHVDVIDTWRMTVERLRDTLEGAGRVELPGRPYMAVRLVAL